MSNPIVILPPSALTSVGRQRVADPTAPDDLVLDRLATWLAEVSAEADDRPPSTDVQPPTAELASS